MTDTAYSFFNETPCKLLHFQQQFELIFYRYHIQDNDASQDALLHRKPDHPLRGHHVPHGAGVLPALRLRGEGDAVRVDPAVADGVLPAARRDHPPHLARRAASGEIPALHYDFGHILDMGNGVRAQRPLQVSVARRIAGLERDYVRLTSAYANPSPIILTQEFIHCYPTQ